MPGTDTLVKYDNPVLVSTQAKKPAAAGTAGAAGKARPGKLPPVDAKPQVSQTEDVLDSILPPREWEESSQLWVQHVSSAPATRSDVITLQEQLDARLKERQARETGICPIRQELFSQCFDELIRQVTVNCTERGILLLRVRDEMRMTLAAYQTLYESAIAFGMRKALQAEQGKAEMESRISHLEGDKQDLERQVAELKARIDAMEKRETERRALDEKKHAEEIAFYKRTNAQLKTQLESLLAPSAKK